jgi:AraC family transcriptional regulator
MCRSVKLEFGTPSASAQQQEAAFPGFCAEWVQLPSEGHVQFERYGQQNYVALHDMRLRDGETRLDGVRRREEMDLRDKITFAPSDARISGWSHFENRPNSYVAFTFDPHVIEMEYERPFRQIDARPLLYFVEASLAFTLRKMERELRMDAPDLFYLETLGLCTALEVERIARGGILNPAGITGRLSPNAERRVREYIRANLVKDVSLSELAAVAGLSRFHFSRSFRNSFGLAPRQYILKNRVEEAKLLIAEHGTGLPELSALLGFSTPARLAAAFKQYAGCTIGEFQREHG